MNDILSKPTVLVLNRHWQAIHVKTPAEAFCMMASDAATALDIAEGHFVPTKWSDWLGLPVREHDSAVKTPRGQVRVPTVIVAANYAKVPLRRPRHLGARRRRLPIHGPASSRRRKATSMTSYPYDAASHACSPTMSSLPLSGVMPKQFLLGLGEKIGNHRGSSFTTPNSSYGKHRSGHLVFEVLRL